MDAPTDSHAQQRRINPRYERYRWQVFGITWLAYAGFYLTRKAFSVAKTELVKPEAGGWSKSDMAWVDGTYLTTYALGQFLWGVLGDRFGTRLVVLVGMAASVVVCATMGASSTVIAFAVLFGIQGLCQSAGWAPLAKNMGEFFSRKERGRVMGLWCTNYAFGGFLASAIAGIAITTALDQGVGTMFAWRYAFWVASVLLAIIWVLFWLLQRNRPENVGLPPIEVYHDEPVAVAGEEDTAEEEAEGSWKVILAVLSNRMVLLLAVVYFFLKPTRYMILFSAPLYVKFRLEQAGLDASAAEAGILGSMFDLAGPLGALFGGFVSDKVFQTRRMPASVIALLLVGAFLLVFPNLPPTRAAIGAGFFLIGFLLYIPDTLISGAAAIDFGTKKGASTAVGIINGFGSVGAIIGGTMPGWIESIVGKGNDVWGYVFAGLSISIFIGAALLLPKWNQLPPGAKEHAASSPQSS